MPYRPHAFADAASCDVELHVADLRLDVPDGDGLSDEERARARRFVAARDRTRYRRTHAHLRATLARALGTVPAAVALGRDARGKPRVAAPSTTLRFNLTHSADLAIVALAHGVEVGVDVEALRPVERVEGLADRCLSPGERAEIAALPAGERSARFLRKWVLREALLKATGEGLSRSPADLATAEREDGEARVLVAPEPDACRWACRWFVPVAGYVAAVVACAPHARFRTIRPVPAPRGGRGRDRSPDGRFGEEPGRPVLVPPVQEPPAAPEGMAAKLPEIER
ncbi:MAG: 4'-phosphopantetheinyl transferase family protein [Paracoccaceae bacterium]